MVGDTVIGAIIGVGGAIIGSLLTGGFNWLSTRQKIQAEDSRRRGEMYLEKKIDILSSLHKSIANVEYQFMLELNSSETVSEDRSSELYDILDEFNDNLSKSSVFLSQIQDQKLHQFGFVAAHVGQFLDPHEDFTGDSEYDELREMLKNNVNEVKKVLEEEFIDPIKQFEE